MRPQATIPIANERLQIIPPPLPPPPLPLPATDRCFSCTTAALSSSTGTMAAERPQADIFTAYDDDDEDDVILGGIATTPVSLSEASELSDDDRGRQPAAGVGKHALTDIVSTVQQQHHQQHGRSAEGVKGSDRGQHHPNDSNEHPISASDDDAFIDEFDVSFEELSGAEDYRPMEAKLPKPRASAPSSATRHRTGKHARVGRLFDNEEDEEDEEDDAEEHSRVAVRQRKLQRREEYDADLYGLRRSSRVRLVSRQYQE
ncbi:hypothetical protein SYNPS1DRAFT_30086, partial [Syncephalis pseudoplumigaleata]